MIAFIFFAAIVLLILLKYFYFRKSEKGNFKDLREIPHPDGLPLIGNTAEIFWNEFDTWNMSRKRALDYYPIYRLKMLNRNIVFLLHPEDIKMILGETDGSIKGSFYDPFRKLAGNGLVINNGKSWSTRRKLLTKCFHFSVLKEYIGLFNKEISSLISLVQKKTNEMVDVPLHIQNMTFRISNETILGNKSTHTEKESRDYINAMKTVSEITFLKSTKPFLNLVWPLLQIKKEEDEALRNMDSYISKAIEDNSVPDARKDKAFLTMLDHLLSAPELFDSTAVRNEIDTFIFGAQDTTSTILSFMMMVLANYPHYQDSLYEEIKKTIGVNGSPTYADLTSMEYLDRFTKETLRLYPPLMMIERLLTKEVITKTGYRLPIGTTILFSIFDIHRNPNLFSEPEVFDPDRFLLENVVKKHPFSYIPFSAGPRNCIAQKFALLVIKATICGILQNFKLEPGTIIDNIEFSPDVILQIKGGIKVKLLKR